MRLAKNYVPSDKAVNIKFRCMMKGGALPPFFVTNGLKPAVTPFANDPSLVPIGNDVGKWLGKIWQRETKTN